MSGLLEGGFHGAGAVVGGVSRGHLVLILAVGEGDGGPQSRCICKKRCLNEAVNGGIAPPDARLMPIYVLSNDSIQI